MKDLHIVWGMQARALVMMGEFYNSDEMDLVCFEDLLSIGPLSHLDTKEGIENRACWLAQLEPRFDNQFASIVQSDAELIEKIKSSDYKGLFLWTGSDVSEILCASRLLFHLKWTSLPPVLTIDFLHNSVTQRIGEFVYPKSLKETAINQISALFHNFAPLNCEQFESMQLIWKNAIESEAYLRIANDQSEISGAEIEFYDAGIKSHCTRRYQAAYRVIGKTLGLMNEKNIGEGVCDSFLNWRLKQLAQNGKLKYRGTLSYMRDYEVKLT